MRKFLSLVFVLLFFTTISFAQVGVIPEGRTTPLTNQTSEEVRIENLKQTVLKVIDSSVSVSMFGIGIGTCSGTVIKNTQTESIVLTAKHCIGTSEEIYVEGLLVEDLGISIKDDIAYLKINQEIPNKSAIIISNTEPRMGDLVIIIGYPNFHIHISVGEISVKTQDWRFAKINIIPGCSGAGAYNEEGELIGIVWGSVGKSDEQEKSTVGVFERWEDVIKFIKDKNLL